MAGNITVSTAAVPEGTCPSWIISLWPTLVGLLTANLQGSQNTINYGSATPSPGDTSKPWWRVNTDGTPDRIYTYSGGLWISRHNLLPGARIIAPSTLVTAAQVWAWDGGSGVDPAVTVPGGAVGAMWEVDPDLTAKFPLGAGTSPSPSLTNFLVNATGGEENHQLSVSELAAHAHSSIAGTGGIFRRKLGDPLNATSGGGGADYDANVLADTGGNIPHNTMPLYRVVIFIRRTNRLYYTP